MYTMRGPCHGGGATNTRHGTICIGFPPPPRNVWSGRGWGGGAWREGSGSLELLVDGGVVLGGGQGSHASTTQAINPLT